MGAAVSGETCYCCTSSHEACPCRTNLNRFEEPLASPRDLVGDSAFKLKGNGLIQELTRQSSTDEDALIVGIAKDASDKVSSDPRSPNACCSRSRTSKAVRPKKKANSRSSDKRRGSKGSCVSDATLVTESTVDTLRGDSRHSTGLSSYLPAPSEITGAALQRSFGAQSRRGGAQQFQLNVLDDDPHCKACFQRFYQREEELCGDFAVFYHSYTDGAVMYELYAALAQVLYGFDAQQAPLPRLFKKKFKDIPDSNTLKHKFETDYIHNKKDHHQDFRDVAFSVMCSVVSKGPEVSVPVVFRHGYNHRDDRVTFPGLLYNLLLSLLPKKGNKEQKEAKELMDRLLQHCERYHLDTHNYIAEFGKLQPMVIGGHMLQIFIRRDLVDRLAYASEPFGNVDTEREPVSNWIDGDTDVSWGQARLISHPEYFMDSSAVKMYVASADEDFHRDRQEFQEGLSKLFNEFLTDPGRRDFAMAALADGQCTSSPVPSQAKTWKSPFSFKLR